MNILFLIGRIIFGGFFLYNSYKHLHNNAGMISYAQFKGVPMPKLAIIGSGILILLGGFSMITGLYPKLGVLCIALFLIPVTFQMHAYWKEEGEARTMQHIQFNKNMAILGAALMLLAIPTPWPFSL